MRIFLLLYFILYGGMNFFVLMKTRTVLGLKPLWSCFFAIFLLIMVLAPFFIRFFEKAGQETVAMVIAYSGYTWMGFVFLFFLALVATDFCRLAYSTAHSVLGRSMFVIPRVPVWLFAVAFFLAAASTLYGLIEASNVKTEYITLRSPKIKSNGGHLRVAQISDIHLGLLARDGQLKRVLEIIHKESPDILVATGDIVDGLMDDIKKFAGMFREIETKYGKFAVPGNHEYYAGIENSLEFFKASGFTILRDEVISIENAIRIAGADDDGSTGRRNPENQRENDIFRDRETGIFTILLKHRPVVNEGSIPFFDLQLSGHVHGGQIFPFGYVVRFFFPYFRGFYRVGEGTYIYVNRGTGTWGPPIRFLSPPEITIIDLVNDKE